MGRSSTGCQPKMNLIRKRQEKTTQYTTHQWRQKSTTQPEMKHEKNTTATNIKRQHEPCLWVHCQSCRKSRPCRPSAEDRLKQREHLCANLRQGKKWRLFEYGFRSDKYEDKLETEERWETSQACPFHHPRVECRAWEHRNKPDVEIKFLKQATT